ncbi:uncharacterized protein LOC135808466 isoform X2 [Sycon ciliatum]|uniref:uncharacterized protein LOC135808466 isoform X2 n=1 Tax=Sycon ciliatum TaxID=27933 RepID=UPI0031F68565
MARKRAFLSSPAFVYIQAYFLTIASVLGTGILGLPVTLSNSGLTPFLVTFVATFLIQVVLIYFFVDLLQKTSHHLLQDAQEKVSTSSGNDISLQSLGGKALSREESSSEEDEAESNPFKSPVKGTPIRPSSAGDDESLQPNLHNMGRLFLGPWAKYGFDLVILVQFVAFLTGYSLAGSQAFQQLFHISSLKLVIPVFVWTNVAAIVFAQVIVKPLVSIMTLLKGGILIVTVVVAFVVGSKIHNHTTVDFGASGEPFLMGIVAVGGVVNMMPLMYTKVDCRSAKQVTNFRRAVTLGMLTCAVLNTFWCYAVLSIVSQRCSLCVPSESRPSWMPLNVSQHCCHIAPGELVPDECVFCLQQANTHGRISTVPLINVVGARYPNLSWMALLIELFIVISITVSFLVYGSALKQLWDGFLAEFQGCRISKCCSAACCHRITRFLAYKLSFGGIFFVALSNPEGFIRILDRVGSMGLNLEIVLFVIPMIRASWGSAFKNMPVVVSLRRWFYWL